MSFIDLDPAVIYYLLFVSFFQLIIMTKIKPVIKFYIFYLFLLTFSSNSRSLELNMDRYYLHYLTTVQIIDTEKYHFIKIQ